ncbi:MAG: hypothetical protein FRX49_12115, partial [Trebouxia sp. A1-2]
KEHKLERLLTQKNMFEAALDEPTEFKRTVPPLKKVDITRGLGHQDALGARLARAAPQRT